MRQAHDSIMYPLHCNMDWSSIKVATSYMMSNGEESSAMVQIIEPIYPYADPVDQTDGAMASWLRQFFPRRGVLVVQQYRLRHISDRLLRHF